MGSPPGPEDTAGPIGGAAVDDEGRSRAPEPRSAPFPILGIGCSAGGLQALERFFSQVPLDSGMAYVVVQHLSPDHGSALPDLLGRFTPLPVVEAGEGMAVAPDHVYVIPPAHDLSLRGGDLRLLEPTAQRGLRLPIDAFFRALAEERRERAIGVVLSGMGSDGVFGLSAIKASGGLTVAQDPASAVADGMPTSAIAAKVVDIVAVPEAMPSRITDHLRHPLPLLSTDPPAGVQVLTALEKIVLLLRDRHNCDFSHYKTNTLCRRIERRMAVHQITGIDQYVERLRESAQELSLLSKELLIGVTSFFRDPHVWDTLRDAALPALLSSCPEGKVLRAWVPACSTGEEAYSLAIVFKEALDRSRPHARISLQIYATDLDPDGIDTARRGVYPDNIAADVGAERLARFFTPQEGGGFRVIKDIRDAVTFATQNVISDPPFTKLDVLSCRNLLIYFDVELQHRVLPLFHYALRPDGLLLLGGAETAAPFAHLFGALYARARIYRRLAESAPIGSLSLPAWRSAPPPAIGGSAPVDRGGDLGQLTDQLILQAFAPPAVLVNAEGDILYVSGRTGKYLEPAAGKTNMNVHAMARDGLREALAGVIRKALEATSPIVLQGLRVGTNGGTQVIDLVVQALDRPAPLRGQVILVFKDVAAPAPRRKRSKLAAGEAQSALFQELQQAREALQVTHEEMQAAVEELKSVNEELQSSNEEMQSSNEELTTSKEELQSLNEELQTVNAELQSKVDDLTGARNDMVNLLNSTEIATIFLDAGMLLRRFTPHATKLFRLLPGDISRPLWDIATDLDYPRLQSDALDVLQTLAFKETVVSTHDNRWFRARIMPYRTHDNVIDGVVLTFTDVTEIKHLEAQLRQRSPLPAPS